MRYARLLILLSAAVVLSATGCERKVTNEITNVVPAEKAAYVGSKACEACHSEVYASFRKTGHPYKLNEADSVQMPGYFPDFVVPLEIPPDLSWGQIDKIIGGFWWKARYIEPQDGGVYIGPDRQYNLIEGYEGFVAYEGTTPGFIDYNCGSCHTTGYQSTGNQEGKSRLIGTWAFNGIQCEECHGPGGLHVNDPHDVAMTVDRSAAACGECHIRDDVQSIPASGGFIKHHEQWNEMFATKHNALECVDCHDPHVGLHPNNPERQNAIINKCENCHLKETQSYAASDLPHYDNGVTCITCHMAKAGKSAVQTGTYEGDIHSHLMVINTSATATLMKNATTANPYLTLEYTCLKTGCHNPSDPANTKAWAAAYADRVHAPNVSDVGSCFTCHSDNDNALLAARQQYDESVHGTGHTSNENRNAAGSTTCEPCHTHEGFLAVVTGVPAVGDNFTRISCFTCHEPHTTGTLALRIKNEVKLGNSVSYDKGNSNVCVACHKSRRNGPTYVQGPTMLTTRFGPHHSDQADMLLGTNAYEFAGYEYEHRPNAHGSDANGCLLCHMNTAAFATSGHTFAMADEENEYENVRGCNTCHGGEVTEFDQGGAQSEVQVLLDSLETLLEDAGLLAWVDEDGDMVLLPTDSLYISNADSIGALFNYMFVREDRSTGVHNFSYAEELLESSIAFMNGDLAGMVADRPTFRTLAAH
jgi:hypothetical protein